LAVDETPDFSFFSILQWTLPWQPIFVVILILSASIHRTGFALHSADGGIRQEVQFLRWTQANQLTDQLTTIKRRRGAQPGGLHSRFALLLVFVFSVLFCSFQIVAMILTALRLLTHLAGRRTVTSSDARNGHVTCDVGKMDAAAGVQ